MVREDSVEVLDHSPPLNESEVTEIRKNHELKVSFSI